MEIDNPRWAGVPFTLRSGKATPVDAAEVAVHYRPLPHYLRDWFPNVQANVLRVGLLEPTVELSTMIGGPDGSTESHPLTLRSAPVGRGPYANLLLDMLDGDATLTIHADEAEEAWRVVEPVLAAWRNDHVPLQTYPAGTMPPT